MTVKSIPSRITDLPSARGLDANRSFHNRSLIMAAGAACGWSSDGEKSRPRIGFTPRVAKKPEETSMPFRCSDVPGPVKS